MSSGTTAGLSAAASGGTALGAEFAEHERQFREMLEFCPAGLLIVDEEGRLLFHNARLRELLGYQKDELELIDTRTFWHDIDQRARIIEALRAKTRIIFVDFHAEATSEKVAMGWHLDGRVTAVVGTHTHVQTADERILPKGTAYQTDVGMTGPHESIIGVTIEAALGRFLTGMPARFESATGPGRLNAVEVTADQETGKATRIERLSLSVEDLDA